MQDWLVNTIFKGLPDVIYVGLADSLGVEPQVGGYARVPVFKDSLFVDGETIVNSGRVTFPLSSQPWGNMTQARFYLGPDSPSSFIKPFRLLAPQYVGINTEFFFHPRGLTIDCGDKGE